MTCFAKSYAASLLIAAILFATSLRAEDAAPRRLQLVRPNSLIGWMHGDAPPLGWTVDEQRLRGCGESTPLVSGWNFGDFTLEFRWRSVDAGALEVLLATAPEGNLLTIALDENAVGQITDGDQQLAPGIAPSASEDGAHRCQITRSGESLQVTIDGELAGRAAIAGDRRLLLSLNVPRGVVVLDDLVAVEPNGAAIFNGVDLTGWNTHNKENVWKVDNGDLVTTNNGGEYLRSDQEYENFTLSYDYQMERGGNSGLGIRTPIGDWPSGAGMELQMYDQPGKEAGSQMSIYKYLPPLERPDVSEAWNHVVVKCHGPLITAWVNGQIAQHANLVDHAELAKKPRRGWLGFQHHGSPTRIKKVFLLAAPADEHQASPEAVDDRPQ